MSEVIALNASTVRRLVAIAFLDVVGYSRLMGVQEEATLAEGEPATPQHWQDRLERTIALASAEALNGDIQSARELVSELKATHPTLSVNNILWNCQCSMHPGFVAGMRLLRKGAQLAGVPGTLDVAEQ